MKNVVSDLWVSAVLVRESMNKVTADLDSLVQTLEKHVKDPRALDSDISYLGKEFSYKDKGKRVVIEESDIDSIEDSYAALQDGEEIIATAINWAHAISGLKKYIISLTLGMQEALANSESGKFSKEEKDYLRKELSRIDSDILAGVADSIDTIIQEKTEQLRGTPLYTELDQIHRGYQQHLDKATEIVNSPEVTKLFANGFESLFLHLKENLKEIRSLSIE